jgi:hypothetical protein
MPASTQSYDADSFDELASSLSTGASACLVFASSDNERRQKVLATLTEHLPYNLHQVKADTLVGERHIETQGNLRETFDDTGEEGHILVFENADALYELPGAEEEKEAEEERDETTMMPIEYAFERIDSFTGVVVLSFQNQKYSEDAGQRDAVDYVVTF